MGRVGPWLPCGHMYNLQVRTIFPLLVSSIKCQCQGLRKREDFVLDLSPLKTALLQ